MIVQIFSEAANFQQGQDLTKSVSVVNLDEIGRGFGVYAPEGIASFVGGGN
jgi:hypothetical protein